MKPISEEKRELLIAAKMRGETEADIVKWLGVSKGSVGTLWRRHRKLGDAPAGKCGGRPPKLAPGDIERSGAEVLRAPDATLGELIERLALPVGKSQLGRLLAGLGFTLKKRRSIRTPGAARTSPGRGAPGGGRSKA
jgi:transposase